MRGPMMYPTPIYSVVVLARIELPGSQFGLYAGVEGQAEGGQGTAQTFTCISPGMPRATNGYGEIEFVVTPFATYILVQHIDDDRRIYTDGRDWPADIDPTFLGYTADTTRSKWKHAI